MTNIENNRLSDRGKPVTLLTGYLGSGKTTVMNELLKGKHDTKIALIVNDMGSVNIDASLIRKNNISVSQDNMIELQNGCICCTLQEEFMTQVEILSSDPDVDAILVEASGISNPASIAEAFLAYQEIHPESNVYLNSIVTVVDADRIYSEFLADIENQLNCDDNTVEDTVSDTDDDTVDAADDDADIINLVSDQIEFCNLILLNKCDLLDQNKLMEVKNVLRQLQPEAEIVETVYGKLDAEVILSKQRFDYVTVSHSSTIQKALDHAAHHKEHHEDISHNETHSEYGISSFVYEEKHPFDYDRFMAFIENDYPETLIRAKGYIWFADDDIHVQLFEQAGRNASVSEVSNWLAAFDEEEQNKVLSEYPDMKDDWDPVYGDRVNQIVFIGKNYDQNQIIDSLNSCIVRDSVN